MDTTPSASDHSVRPVVLYDADAVFLKMLERSWFSAAPDPLFQARPGFNKTTSGATHHRQSLARE